MDPKEMRALLRLMKSEGVAEFTLKGKEEDLTVRFAGVGVAQTVVMPPAPVQAAAPSATPTSAAAARPAGDQKSIKSPIVGTFYRSASPDAAPYVAVGDRIRKGQVVCIVEAMKLMNQIEADVEGVVAEILVDNAQPVQFGQELIRLTPA